LFCSLKQFYNSYWAAVERTASWSQNKKKSWSD